MKNILKSYFRSYFKNWIEAFGLIIFVVIIFAIIVGMIGIPLEFNTRYQKINKDSTTWNYSLNLNQELNPDFVYHYYQANDTHFNDEVSGKTIDPVHQPFLSDNKLITLNGTTYNLADYLTLVAQQTGEQPQQYLGQFIINTVQDLYKQRDMHLNAALNIPLIKGASIDKNQNKASNFIDKAWAQQLVTTDFFQLEYSLNQQIALVSNQDANHYQLDTNLVADYQTRIGTQSVTFRFDLINSNLSDNVVLETNNSRLPNNDQEMVVNQLFANTMGWKINSSQELLSADFLANNKFKITGFGDSITNLFPVSNQQGRDSDIKKFAMVYLTPTAQHSIINALMMDDPKNINISVNQRFNLHDYNFQKLSDLYNKVAITPGTSSNKLFAANTVPVATNVKFVSFSDLPALSQVKSLTVIIFVFGGLGLVLLILALVFINFVLKKEMNKTVRQIGLFKAFGYKNGQLSWIFATKTAITMVVGAAIGYAVSIPIQQFIYSMFGKIVTLNMTSIFTDWWFMLIIIILLPAIFTAASFLMTLKNIKTPCLQLLNDARPIKIQKLSNGIGKLFSKANFIVRLQVAYTTRSLGKSIIIFILFFISCLLMLMQFDGGNLMTSMGSAMNETYQDNLDHIFDLSDFTPKWAWDNNHKITFKNADNYNLEFKGYKTDGATPVSDLLSLSHAQDQDIFTLINNYLHDRTATSHDAMNVIQSTLGNDVKAILNNTTFIHNGLQLSTLETLLQDIKADYAADLIDSQVISTDAMTGVKGLEKQFSTLNQFMANPIPDDTNKLTTDLSPVIGFNTVFYQQSQAWLATEIKVTSAEQNYQINDFNIELVDGSNAKNYLKINGISSDQWSNVFDTSQYQNQAVPVIITNKLAVLNHWKIGQTVNVKINTSDNDELKIAIRGINSADNFSSNIYAAYTPFAKTYLAPNFATQQNLSNTIYANYKILKNKLDINNLQDMKNNKVQDFSFGIYYESANADFNFATLLEHLGQISKATWAPLIDHSYQGINLLDLQRQGMENAMKITKQSFTVFQVMDAFMLFVILVVIISSIVEETMSFILVMKSIGYFNNEINFIVIGNYVLEIIIAFLIAYGISALIWSAVTKMFVGMVGMVLPSPMSWTTPLIVLAIMVVIMLIGWILSLRTIKSRSVTNIQQ